MRRSTFGAALSGVVLAGLAMPACVSRAKYEAEHNVALHYRRTAEEMKAYQDELDSENRALRARVAALDLETTGNRTVIEEAGALREEYERRLRELEDLRSRLGKIPAAEAGDIEIFRGPEGTTVRIQDRILFASGSHEVTAEGINLLKRVAAEIGSSAKGVRVEGHTDSDPVRVTKDRYPMGNLQLSAMRAVNVGRILAQQGGIPEQVISAIGYGEWRPLVANDSAENKRRNRRVEIVLIE
jgi:chemotaxis protein MotB